MMRNLLQGVFFCITLFTLFDARASIVINGTRVIYKEEENEVTLRLNNAAEQPSLVQVWLDSGDAKSTPETGKSPFIATPPIFRVDPGKGQTIRFIYTQDPLPQDKESVFWVNILDVPPRPIFNNTDNTNYMQLAIRSRIKLFFRPKGLVGTSTEAAEQVHWKLIQQKESVALRATNDAVFHVSLDGATVTSANKKYAVNTQMLAPGSTRDFLVEELKTIPSETQQLTYTTVNDFGSAVQHTVTLPY